MKEFFLELDIYDIISNPLPNFTQFDTGGVFHFTLTVKFIQYVLLIHPSAIDWYDCSMHIIALFTR